MMPAMRSITLLRIIEDKNNINAMMTRAPTKAPINTDKKPDTLIEAVVILPPKASITKATPKLAPASMPKIEGPANGFFRAVCNIKPHTANEPPQSKAVSACGKRLCQIINRQLVFSGSSPKSMRTTSPTGMDTDPTSRLAANNSMITTVNTMPYLSPLLIQSLIIFQSAHVNFGMTNLNKVAQ